MSITNNTVVVWQTEAEQAAGIPAHVTTFAPKRIAQFVKDNGRNPEINDLRSQFKDVGATSEELVECTDNDLPDDKTFRNAWDLDKYASDRTFNGKRVKLNKARGVEITKENIRAVRNKKLAEKDIEVLRADEEGNSSKKAEVLAKKQKLRDATDDPRITAASNETELKTAMESICAECEAE